MDVTAGASVPLSGLGREPAEEFTGALEIVRMDFLSAGQRPALLPRVLPMQQHGDKCAPNLVATTVLAKKRLRMILDDELSVLVLYHDRKFGDDTECVRLGACSEMPSQLCKVPSRQLVTQVQRKHQLKYVSHGRAGY
ncbi:hypothetical protein [Streptomyces sp. MUSC 14]|uniref:hypothetical protein n=1 Tax=Streptomyces sp. MUSC 14 TaxID=1354889 RepID=UPI0015A68487|nr:hypothetical protein [Streptomyces sp. MUSC 14]